MKTSALPPLLLLAPLALRRTLAFVLPPSSPIAVAPSSAPLLQLHHADDVRASSPRTQLQAAAGDGTDGASTAELSRAPTLNGKAVLPVRAMTAGLKGHTVAAVYAVLNADYTRGSGEGWEHVEHVGVTRDLAADLSHFLNEKGASDVAHVRALSFAYPQKAAMDDFAAGWRMKVAEAGGAGSGEGWGTAEGGANGSSSSGEEGAEMATPAAAVEGASNIITVGDEYEFDDDDEDMDDDDLDDYLQMMAEARGATSSPAAPAPAPLFVDNTGLSGIVSLGGGDDKATEKEEVVSPFDKAVDKATVAAQSLAPGEDLELNADNVDRVLDEVRPYLISDGGNVSVHSVDSQTGNVFLLLEGACGSCASSTVTMQMGIERVLREKFGDRLGEVAQIDPDDGTDGGAPKELTLETVQAEVDRISTAIIAMGGVVRVVGVDPVGEVEVEFRGPNRVRKGLELALLDVEFVKHVKFVS